MAAISPQEAKRALELRKNDMGITPEMATQALNLRQNTSDVPMPNDINMPRMQNNNIPLSRQIADQLLGGVHGAGNQLSNAMSSAGSNVLSGISGLFGGPRIDSQPIQTGPQNAGYEVGKFSARSAPYLIPGTGAGRIGLGVVNEGLTNGPDMLENAIEGGLYAVAGEALPGLAKIGGQGIKSAADKLVRKEYTDEVLDLIASQYNTAKESALSYLTPLMDKYGDKAISPRLKSKIDSEYERLNEAGVLSADADIVKKIFDENPNPRTLQELQSQIGYESRGLDLSSSAERQTEKMLRGFKEDLQKSLKDVFNTYEKDGGDMYQTFLEEYAKDPAKYQNDPLFKKIIKGNKFDVTPQKLNKALQKGTEGSEPLFPKNHPMAELAPEFQRKLNRSELYTGLGTIGAGVGSAALGGQAFGPLGYTLGALGYYAPNIIKRGANTLLNPELENFMMKLATGYPALRAGAQGARPQIKPEAIEIDLIGE